MVHKDDNIFGSYFRVFPLIFVVYLMLKSAAEFRL